ncbi:MAG: hypothetical protein MI861_22985, partial [Pirellulales bacterium]|nr:hypothetical protein [Pirellulales bacterium]
MRRLIFLLAVSLCWSLTAQDVTTFVRYEGPVVSDPVEKRYGWRSTVNHSGDRIAATYGRWDGAGEVRIFDLQSGKTLHRIDHPTGLRGLCLHPSGEQFATGDFAGNMVLRRFSDGQITRQ